MTRPHRGCIAAALWIALACHAADTRLIVQSSPLAGFRYYAAADVWHAMRPGDPLDLVREPDNMHDDQAVRVMWKGRLLGYLPRHDNDHIAAQLDRGATVRARIVKLAQHRNRSRRLEFEIYIDL